MSANIIELDSFKGGSASVPPDILNSSIMGEVEVIGIREGGLIDCWMPSELIDHEEVPVKAEWVSSLAKDMANIKETDGGNGQLTPIILGYIDGEPKLKIIDGFHRDAALRANGETSVYTTVKQTDWDELFDIRIFTAKDNKHVRFSRVVQWIREVWQYSGMADELTVEQAVLMYRFETPGSRLGISPEVAEAAKTWVARKEAQWQVAAMTIHSHLKIAENVDPKLVHTTREKTKGRVLEAPTQIILKTFSDNIPGKFGLQNAVMDAAKAQNLKGPEIKALCLSVKDMTIANARKFIEEIDWDLWEPAYGETTQKKLRRAHDARYKGKAVFSSAMQDVANTSERLAITLRRGEDVTPEMRKRLLEAREGIDELMQGLGEVSIRLSYVLGDSIPVESQAKEKKYQAMHQAWGLSFREYEDEVAPAVYIDHKGVFDLSDLSSGILLALARHEPGKVYTTDQIQVWLGELGFNVNEEASDAAIRRSIHQIHDKFVELEKDGHLVVRSGGLRKVLAGLI